MDPVAIVVIVVVVLVALGAGIPIGFAVRRSRIRGRIEAFGWQVDPSRSLARVAPLKLPPFDQGFGREISTAIVGTTSAGTGFQAFRYVHTRPPFSAWVAMVALPVPLPELYLSTDHGGHVRQGLTIPRHEVGERWAPVLEVATADHAFADALLSAPVLDALAGWASSTPRGFDLSVDGANLVGVGSPTTDEPDQLRDFVDRLDGIARLIDRDRIGPYETPPVVPRVGLRGTDWTYTPTAPELVATYAGIGPIAPDKLSATVLDRLSGRHRGIDFDLFEFQWQTVHTTSDGQGGTRTYRETHRCPVSFLVLPTALPSLTIAFGRQEYARTMGPVQDTGHVAFDQTFDVWSSHPAFVADVMTPQVIDWLLHWRPPLIMIHQNLVIGFPVEHDPSVATASLDFLCAFCDLIDDRVWARTGAPRPGTQPEPSRPELPSADLR